MLGLACGLLLAAPPVYRFDDGPAGWLPVRPSIAVTTGPGHDGTGLQVRGTIADGWNYARSPQFDLAADQRYELRLWLRVDLLGEGSPAPFVKVELLAGDGGSLGRVATGTYDARRGGWQELSVRFVPPREVARAWLALEKGTDSPCEIEAVIDEITLVAIEPARSPSLLRPYELDPIPAPLAAQRGRHPRLYLTAERLAALRQACGGTHRELAERLLARADELTARPPPEYREDDGWSGDEQLWQREVGNTMPYLALAWLISGEAKYLDAAAAWAVASCEYPTWGLGNIDGMDLATGHQMFGLAIVYDWCQEALRPEVREQIRATLLRRGGAQYEAASRGRAWWHEAYLQNHLWVNATGLAAAGIALWDEHPPAADWIAFARDRFATTLSSLGDDGASHEGVGYWQYGVEYLLKYLELARDLLGEDLYDHPWWRNTADYALYLTLPRRAWTPRSSLVDIADCPRGNWYGPEYLLRRLAAEYRNPVAQWHAAEIDAAGIGGGSAGWLNLLWHDATLAPSPPLDLPTLRWFRDLDIVSARSDWSGAESLLVAKCGPYLGHAATAAFDRDPGGGHVHPDAGAFVLFGDGEWLLRDDGYQAKFTGQHNTLLIDGAGQLGEGRQWFAGGECLQRRAMPRVVRADSTSTVDTIVLDATEAYAAESGLRRFIRHLLFIKPRALIVMDAIELDRPRPLELRFHPEQAAEAVEGGFVARGERAVMRLEPLTTAGVEATAERLATAGRHNEGGAEMETIRLRTTAARWNQVTAVTWCAAGGEPQRVTAERLDAGWRFSVGGRTIDVAPEG